MSMLPHLSKSRFVDGLQCHKRLWWRVHEPETAELVADGELLAIFERGRRIGEVARGYVPGGVLIDLPYEQLEERVAATARAIAAGARVIYEASFLAGGVFVAVDILERRDRGSAVPCFDPRPGEAGQGLSMSGLGAGPSFETRPGEAGQGLRMNGLSLAAPQKARWGIIEVKSTLDLKAEHLADVAIQLAVVRGAGLRVTRAEVMHLNRGCRAPELGNLFLREDVTRKATRRAARYGVEIEAQLGMLVGGLPVVEVGEHCFEPHECPFLERCWPAVPEHHVSTLYSIRRTKVQTLVAGGWTTIHDLPEDFAGSVTVLRQIRSVRAGTVVVERGLGRALRRIKSPVAFLDFETVAPAIPVWAGCAPFEAVPVQMSVHREGAQGLEHRAWLASGPGDPREGIARALLDACEGAKTVLVYNASFERRCIAALAGAVPALRGKLGALGRKLVDLLPIVRDHVYHPGFDGSFSLKQVLPALVPELGYGDLAVQGGMAASDLLERLLLREAEFSPAEREQLRAELLAYCERDTLAMVKLVEKLRELAEGVG
jgi:Domain of unknown function(DUF2779)